MPMIRNLLTKCLVVAVAGGALSLGAAAGAAGTAGAAGAAGTAGAAGAAGTARTGSAPTLPWTHRGDCATVQADLTRMHHRQSVLAAHVSTLEASGLQAARSGKARRAAVMHRALLHWQRMQSRKINAHFLQREAALAALADGHCRTTPSEAPSSTPGSTRATA